MIDLVLEVDGMLWVVDFKTTSVELAYISFIEGPSVIRDILNHLGLWLVRVKTAAAGIYTTPHIPNG